MQKSDSEYEKKEGYDMGLFDFVRGQMIEVIEATDFSQDTIVFQFPVQGNEIKMGAHLIVREGQCAVFLNEGVIADVFGPGRYTLITENMPLLTKLKSWEYGFNSPFKAEVFFVSTRLFNDQKWGTQKPILRRDAEFGMVRMSAFGIFSFKVIRPEVFLREIFGTLPTYTTKDIVGYLRRMVVSRLADAIGELQMPIIDLVSSYDELGEAGRTRMQPAFEAIGLFLQQLIIESISLPEEVEKVIDKRTSMGVLGDLGQYTRYQSAEAIRDAARNPGGIAGVGVGLGAGAQVGRAFADSVAAPAAAPAAGTIRCVSCGSEVDANAKFCPECGKNPRFAGVPCPKCGKEIKADAKFCPECGAALRVTCKKCGAQGSGKFCAECGAPLGE